MGLWAVTAYFNPQGYQARLHNYRCFRRHLGLPLLTLEWSVTGAFQLDSADAELLIRRAGGDLMWQKERLLSIAARALPADCDAVLLIDADLLLLQPGWQEQLEERLRAQPVVQPFATVQHLPPLPEAWRNRPLLAALNAQSPFYLARQSFADHWLRGVQPQPAPSLMLDSAPEHQQEVRRLASRPSFGHAWAVRRDWLDQVGLYEHCVAGSGDLAFAMAISGRGEEFCRTYPLNSDQQAHYLRWAVRAAQHAGAGRIGVLDGVALHLFHGHLSRRRYRARLELLAASGFDPVSDLLAALDQPLQWAQASVRSTQLRLFFAAYFSHRAEDAQPSAVAWSHPSD